MVIVGTKDKKVDSKNPFPKTFTLVTGAYASVLCSLCYVHLDQILPYMKLPMVPVIQIIYNSYVHISEGLSLNNSIIYIQTETCMQ